MTDNSKPITESPPSVEAVEDSELKGGRADLDMTNRDNAVGYEEYLEARDIEFSDAEVCCAHRVPIAPFDTVAGQKAPLEARSRHSPHVPDYPSPAVHGQNITQLCQSLRIPGGIGPQGEAV